MDQNKEIKALTLKKSCLKEQKYLEIQSIHLIRLHNYKDTASNVLKSERRKVINVKYEKSIKRYIFFLWLVYTEYFISFLIIIISKVHHAEFCREMLPTAK